MTHGDVSNPLVQLSVAVKPKIGFEQWFEIDCNPSLAQCYGFSVAQEDLGFAICESTPKGLAPAAHVRSRAGQFRNNDPYY